MKERRHIKVEVFIQDGKKYWRVLEQTHRGGKFNNDNYTFIFKGFVLASYHCPGNRDSGAYLRGDSIAEDGSYDEVPSEAWLYKFRAAIKEYNRVNGEVKSEHGTVEVIE